MDLQQRIDQLEGQLSGHLALAQKLQDAEDALQDLQDKEREANDRADRERRRATVAEDKLKQVQDQAKASASTVRTSSSIPPQTAAPTVYVSRDRRLPKLRGPKQKVDDPDVDDWVLDMEDAVSSRPMKPKEAVEFIMDHLAGEAKAEIRHRPASVRDDPKELLAILQEVFGDKRALSNRYEAFYRRQQGPGESLLDYSIALLKAWGRVEKDMRPGDTKGDKEQLLKDRLAEGVRDEALRRELRRLNMDLPQSTFWQFRDRALKWLGAPKEPEVTASVKEAKTSAKDSDLLELLKKQQEQLAALSEEVKKLGQIKENKPGRADNVSMRGRGRGRGRGGDANRGRGFNQQGARVCFRCQSPTHFIQECPQAQGGPEAAVPSGQQQDP